MKRVLLSLCVIFLLLFFLVSCTTTASVLIQKAEILDSDEQSSVSEPDKATDPSSATQIIFKSDKGRFDLVLSKEDMSAKLFHYGLQVKEGYWTSAAAALGANMLIFIDEKPLELFLDPITNEYSIDITYESSNDTLRCDFNSWYGKLRKFISLQGCSGEIVFYGASNFAYWTTMKTDLAPFKVHNHAVGGLTDKQLLDAAPVLLYPYNPSTVVLLTGSNDYANIMDVSDEQSIIEDMMKRKDDLYQELHKNLPDTRIIVVAGFPTPKRSMYTSAILKVNERIKAYCEDYSDWMSFCDVCDFTYNISNDTYEMDYFLSDKLHLTREARVRLAEDFIKPILEKTDAVKGPVVSEPQKHMLYSSTEDIPFYDGKADEPFLISYEVQSAKPTKALIIFHGGGFISRSLPKEGEDIAEYFSREHGYTCFVCYYRINTNYRAIVSDSIRFVKQIRANAEEFNIDPDQICLLGFSAGGSLALLESQHYMDEEYVFSDELVDVDGQPDYLCLLYPGSSFLSPTKNRFFKTDYSEVLALKYDPVLNILDGTNPVFIAQAEDDAITPIEGTYRLASAFEEKGVDLEFHVFSHGDHGFALGNNEETVQWRELFADWLDAR